VFAIYDSNGNAVNTSTFTNAQRTINWSGLSDGNYTYNVTANDLFGNLNKTGRRAIVAVEKRKV